ncbi:monovalent cation/H(+) antiporter subunit G [Sphingobacterium spiritivorum]|uniref:Monovalent cation/proton antiporter, MnhG/PhaG subunit n=2 Tax=Sphingobacterium spiritivorum TaxID=258 RepID=D7VJG2_SPHSI|nr:monovalent cation/H(+) antiporter subunit G [Sphingobacterium spiritivorum]EFK59015.1 monovalent cation/proton antiporter, MnhG/PhaG subunit [Sphingobacterium spiritivorum ATCC 33861]QQT36874.1 monovalent cation/H(+) antiporter subunit G [Sphingobacterium spiritivorum]WQD33632.1 monovalent cation/H(+) antiporter subunit G [Sphingobacterium spiritivorum]SUJ25521.1 Multiple resistance and pH homeostasis protein G [Sphingobacterium spiritivorum]
MTDIFLAIFSTIGALAILFASIGILRMPDFYLRLSVTVKAATLGVGFFLLCAAIIFPDVSVTTKAIAITFFLILTAPVAAHMIGRAAYITGAKLWKGTIIDDLEGKYDEETHQLKGEEEEN